MKAGESTIIRNTFSLCPVCLKKIPAVLERRTIKREDGRAAGEASFDKRTCGCTAVFMEKECPEHGSFSVPVWHDRFDLEKWIDREEPMTAEEAENCDGNCRICMSRNMDPAAVTASDTATGAGADNCSTASDGSTYSHGQGTCCAILEVTRQCDLHCTFCFAYGGESDEMPSYEELCRSIDDIAIMGGGPLIQFSGGEPTLRDDLPALIKFAADAGCQYTQINSNGIRLSQDEDYVRQLAEAGLDIVFLQFDGTDDEVYRKLRGRDMLDIKLKAIENCGRYGIGVTLAMTVVRDINDHELGRVVRMAAELFPAVRAVHYQPVTYLGRYPLSTMRLNAETGEDTVINKDAGTNTGTDTDTGTNTDAGKNSGSPLTDHYTLDELMADLCEQTEIPEDALLPSRCDHAMCEFHSTFMVSSKRQLIPLTDRKNDVRRERTPAAKNRKALADHWRRDRSAAAGVAAGCADGHDLPELQLDMPLICLEKEDLDFDEFVRKMKTHTIKISAMAFQDASNIDLERLHRCSLHVYEDGKLIPFCAKYLTALSF